MSEYTDGLTAEQLIAYIANDYVELSYDKISWQRDDHMNVCKTWLQRNVAPSVVNSLDEPKDDF